MFSRVRYQFGSLLLKTRKKGDSSWELRYYEPGPPRRRRAVTVGTLTEYPTKSAVRKTAKVQALLMKINEDRAVSAVDLKFGALIGRYEEEEMPERYSTRAPYRSNLDVHIKPRWADTPLASVKAVAVEQWLSGLPLAPKTKAHIRGLMHVLFESAVRWDLLDRNPISHVRVKGGTKRLQRPRILEPWEFSALVSYSPDPYRTMFLIAGCLGLRCSEIVGLQWSDFDFERGTLLIQRGIVHGRIGPAKTEASQDCVPIDPVLAEALLLYRERSYPTAEAWLFANPTTGRPYHQEEIQKRYIRRAAAAAAIQGKVGWHTFRHSYRSWLDEVGASVAGSEGAYASRLHHDYDEPLRHSRQRAKKGGQQQRGTDDRSDAGIRRRSTKGGLKGVKGSFFWHLEKSLTSRSSCATIAMRGGAVW
jgi:integrase